MDKWIVFLICFIACLIISILVYPFFINFLKSYNINQAVSEYSLEEYKNKSDTPIMGGIIFVIIPIVIFLASDPSFYVSPSGKILFILITFAIFCLIGFIDDLVITITKKNDGISPSIKLLLEFGFIIILYILFYDTFSTVIEIPIIHYTVDLKYFYLPFIAFMYVAEANACNFTDGMDGLCAGVSAIGLVCFGVLAFFKAEYHLLLFISCMLGSLVAYLFFNFHPAKIFMGDSGSLALGALFAGLAIALDAYIPLLLISFVFIVEMICVCIQQVVYRLFKKRVFTYTPIHYAFIIKGKKETSVVIGFYIVALISGIAGVIIGIL